MTGETLNNFRHLLDKKKGQREYIKKLIDECEKTIKQKKSEIVFVDEAKLIIQFVAQQTQNELCFYITDLVTLALSAVFDNPYKLGLEFVQRRNKTEADLFFERNGFRYDPTSASGLGPVDIAAFALRTATLSLVRPELRNVIILDEPFRFLKKDLLPKVNLMLKQISEKLGLQIIMITHEEQLMENADRIYKTRLLSNGITRIREG